MLSPSLPLSSSEEEDSGDDPTSTSSRHWAGELPIGRNNPHTVMYPVSGSGIFAIFYSTRTVPVLVVQVERGALSVRWAVRLGPTRELGSPFWTLHLGWWLCGRRWYWYL